MVALVEAWEMSEAVGLVGMLCMEVEEQASLAVLVGEEVSLALLSVSELLSLGM
jgi:hypothetical protein